MATKTKKRGPRVQEETTSSIHIFAYKVLNNRVQNLYPRLAFLEKDIKQAMMPIPFDVYVCSMVFFSVIAGLVSFVVGIGVSFFVNIQPVAFGVLLPFLAGGGVALGTFFILQMIPQFNIKSRSQKHLEEIPHFIGYMATLAASGLTLEGIFRQIALEESNEEIVKDCRFVTRNIEVLGMDLLSAIQDLLKRLPKGSFSDVLEGAIITVQAGGDLKEYFIAQAKVLLEEKKMMMRKATESLGVVSEMYTILLIVFPLIAVIMLAVMAIMSPDLAGFDIMTLMNLLTYVLVPFFGFILLIMMDSMVPKR